VLAELDGRIEMIQALILGMKAVEDEFQAAVTELVGPRDRRGPEDRRFYRWGREGGSVYLLLLPDQRRGDVGRRAGVPGQRSVQPGEPDRAVEERRARIADAGEHAGEQLGVRVSDHREHPDRSIVNSNIGAS
jgi:hypothetical protein